MKWPFVLRSVHETVQDQLNTTVTNYSILNDTAKIQKKTIDIYQTTVDSLKKQNEDLWAELNKYTSLVGNQCLAVDGLLGMILTISKEVADPIKKIEILDYYNRVKTANADVRSDIRK